jgi:uncharacterized protein RhaS with RHS repeats
VRHRGNYQRPGREDCAGVSYEGRSGPQYPPIGTIRFHWNHLNQLVGESDSAGATVARYTWSPDDQLVAIEKNGATYYPHTNARGDVLAITDSAGAKVATYSYGPWGEHLAQTGTFSQPWRYAGYYTDTETGLYYLQ